MPASLAPFRYRNFAVIWLAALVSNVGSWMQTVAVGILVTARTGQAAWTGLVAAAGFLPTGLFSSLGGVVADRFDRRWWLFVTTSAEALAAGALAVLAARGDATPPAVVALVFVGGAAGALGFPAYQALLPDLVGPKDLGAAISLSSAQFNLGRVIGPVLAGVTVLAGGYSWAFASNAASFVAVLAALLVVRLPRRGTLPGGGSMTARLIEGARALRASPQAIFAVACISVVALGVSPFIALIPAMSLTVLHAGAGGTSLLVAAQGVGAVLGALVMTPLEARVGRRRLLLMDLAGVCAALVGYALAPDLAVAAGALVVTGATYIGVLAGLNTVVQLNAPDELRGRMLGVYITALGLLYPAGALIQGSLAGLVGLRAITAAGAVMVGAVVALGLHRGWVPGRLAPGDQGPSRVQHGIPSSSDCPPAQGNREIQKT